MIKNYITTEKTLYQQENMLKKSRAFKSFQIEKCINSDIL